MPAQAFKTKVSSVRPGGQAWCFLPVPLDVKAVFGKARVPVRGTVNGFSFRSTIMPMAGKYWIQFNKQLQAGAKAGFGDTVTVVLDFDDQPRTVKVPPYISKALAASKHAKDAYAELAYSHQKRFVEWVADARTGETRERRIAKMIQMLRAGETID